MSHRQKSLLGSLRYRDFAALAQFQVFACLIMVTGCTTVDGGAPRVDSVGVWLPWWLVTVLLLIVFSFALNYAFHWFKDAPLLKWLLLVYSLYVGSQAASILVFKSRLGAVLKITGTGASLDINAEMGATSQELMAVTLTVVGLGSLLGVVEARLRRKTDPMDVIYALDKNRVGAADVQDYLIRAITAPFLMRRAMRDLRVWSETQFRQYVESSWLFWIARLFGFYPEYQLPQTWSKTMGVYQETLQRFQSNLEMLRNNVSVDFDAYRKRFAARLDEAAESLPDPHSVDPRGGGHASKR